MSAKRRSPQEHEKEAASVAPKPEPSLGEVYQDVYRRIQFYWAEARASQEALALHGVEPTQSQFTAEFHQIDDRFEERSNELRTLLRHTLRNVRKGIVGVVKDLTAESILISLHGELLRKEVPDKEEIIAGVRQKIEGYEAETKAELEALLSAHALPIIHALVRVRAESLSRRDNARKTRMRSVDYQRALKALGLKYVHTLYEVLVKADPTKAKNVSTIAKAVDDKIKNLIGTSMNISVRTIYRWAQGGPLQSRKRFHELMALFKKKHVDDADIARIQEAYSNFRALEYQEEPQSED